MAGPTTEILNDDVKVLREDLHKVETSLKDSIHKVETSLKDSIHKVETSLSDSIHKVETSFKDSLQKVELDLREVSTQVKGLLSAVRLLSVLVLTSLATSIWWGATLTTNSRTMHTRIDKIENTLDKILEQTRPSAK